MAEGKFKRNQRKLNFLREAQTTMEVHTKGLPFAITVPKGVEPTRDNVSFVWVKRQLRRKYKDPYKGLNRRQVRLLKILRQIGVKGVVI